MLELAFQIGGNVLQILGWWFVGACIFFALFVRPFLLMSREPVPAPKPVLVWVNERKAEER